MNRFLNFCIISILLINIIINEFYLLPSIADEASIAETSPIR
jgi:hypothetical protein